MITLFFSLFFVFFQDVEPGSSSELTKIVYAKSENRVDYFFEKPTWENVHSISLEKGSENLLFTFRQKGKVTFQLRLVDQQQIQIRRSRQWEDYNPEKQYLKKEERVQFEDLISGPQFSFNSSRMTSSKAVNPGKSLAVMLDAMDMGAQADNDECTQTGTCS
ncbi:MAG: hypothetical protein AAFV80_20615 [Bacteroidota bacterium]